MTGMRPGDVLMNCYGYGLATGGFGFHYGAMAMDVMSIPMGSDARQYDRMLDFIVDFGATAMCMTPSVGLYVGNKARERGIDFAETQLKIGLFGAEPWPWETRLKLEELFHIRAYDEFGMTEFLGPGMTCECEAREGMHAWADAFLVECIDPETGEPLPEGQDGELVWTWLSADGTAMIRYRSRDLSRTWWEQGTQRRCRLYSWPDRLPQPGRGRAGQVSRDRRKFPHHRRQARWSRYLRPQG